MKKNFMVVIAVILGIGLVCMVSAKEVKVTKHIPNIEKITVQIPCSTDQKMQVGQDTLIGAVLVGGAVALTTSNPLAILAGTVVGGGTANYIRNCATKQVDMITSWDNCIVVDKKKEICKKSSEKLEYLTLN